MKTEDDMSQYSSGIAAAFWNLLGWTELETETEIREGIALLETKLKSLRPGSDEVGALLSGNYPELPKDPDDTQ